MKMYENYTEDETCNKKKDMKTMIVCIVISLILAYLIYKVFFCHQRESPSFLENFPATNTVYLAI